MSMLIWLSSCRDSSEISLEGRLTDLHTGEAVAAATVEVSYSSINNGTFNASGAPVDADASDANGEFALRFEPVNAVAYEVKAYKDGYFTLRQSFEKSEWLIGETTELLLEMTAACPTTFTIKNESEPGTRILFKIEPNGPDCSDCCTEGLVVVDGLADTSWTCSMACPQNIAYSVQLVRNDGIENREGTFDNGAGSFEFKL